MFRAMKGSVAAAALAFAAAAVPHAAQKPTSRAESLFATSSELVVLPVVVIDRHDRFVADLLPGQFSVFDNGRRQDIALFSSEDTPVSVAIVIDTSGSMRRKLPEVIAATMTFAKLSN